jgi:hypothetical protein
MKLDPSIGVLQKDFYDQIGRAEGEDRSAAKEPNSEQNRLIEAVRKNCLAPEDRLAWRDNGWARMLT